MMDGAFFVLVLAAALGCGAIGGVFFAFSAFIMKGLARLPAPHGIAAMQAINVTVITPSFMLALFGTALACLVLAVRSLLTWQAPGAAYLLAGGLLYLIGVIFVTMVCNVPRNNALAAIDATRGDSASQWLEYARSWTAWNSVRAAAAIAAAASLILALVSR